MAAAGSLAAWLLRLSLKEVAKSIPFKSMVVVNGDDLHKPPSARGQTLSQRVMGDQSNVVLAMRCDAIDRPPISDIPSDLTARYSRCGRQRPRRP